jgi:hypothetical protein
MGVKVGMWYGWDLEIGIGAMRLYVAMRVLTYSIGNLLEAMYVASTDMKLALSARRCPARVT